jgi:hypothetical protein
MSGADSPYVFRGSSASFESAAPMLRAKAKTMPDGMLLRVIERSPGSCDAE